MVDKGWKIVVPGGHGQAPGTQPLGIKYGTTI